MAKVYVVEDDENIREIVLYALRSAGFEAAGFETGAEFFAAMKNLEVKNLEKNLEMENEVKNLEVKNLEVKNLEMKKTPCSLALLDIMLPGGDGLAILKRLRSQPQTRALPVIMLTAKGSEFDKVKGLDMGADDYVTKPFSVMELISRVNAVLRRSITKNTEPDARLSVGELTLDDDRRELLVNGGKVNLTYKEYELLHYLVLNAGLVMSREKIMEAVWGYDFEGESRTLDMHVRSLRQKLGDAGSYIQTVRSVGYRLGEV